MATKPRSYKKGSYTYTESAPGSNKFQNFTARPTVKQVRDESRDKKAEAAQPVRSKLENAYSPRDRANVKADLPTISRNPYESSSKKSYPPRQGGMDTAVPPQRKKYPNRQGGMDTGNVVESSPPETKRKYRKVPKSAVLAYGGDKTPVLLKYTERMTEKINRDYKDPIMKARMDKITEPYKPRPLPKAPKKRRSYLQRSREYGLIGALFAD